MKNKPKILEGSKKPAKVMIALPNNHAYFDNNFTMNLIDVFGRFYDWVIKEKREDTLSVIMQGGMQLDEMRNHLVYTALKNNQTHILFLDTDMTFPGDLVPKMLTDLEDNPEVEAITGLYHWKRPPFLPQLYVDKDKKAGKWRMVASFPIDKLFKVDAAGTGCLMIKTEVLKRVKQPYFKFGYSYDEPDPRLTLGEDMFFFDKVKPLTLCDPTIICNHYYQQSCSLKDYIQFNKIHLKDNNLIIDKKQLVEIVRLHKIKT